MKLIDAHSHLYEYWWRVPEILEEAKSVGVEFVIAVSDDLESSLVTVNLAERFPEVRAYVGVHPHLVHLVSREEVRKFFTRLLNRYCDLVTGIGEVGLDRRFARRTLEQQREVFKIFLELARDYGLPVMVHCLRCEHEVLDLLLRYDIEVAVLHWYQGSTVVLRELVAQNYLISVNLSLTYSHRSRLIAELTPLQNIVVESDSPYYFRGMESRPSSVRRVVELLAEVKKESVEKVCEQVYQNSLRLLCP